MAKCSACGKFLSPTGAATCTTCPGIFHKGCVAIPDSVAIPKGWICPECKRKLRKGDNSSTPVKGICDAVAASPPSELVVAGVALLDNMAPLPIKHAALSDADADIRDMRRELAEYMAELREFRREFRASLTAIGDRMDGFEKRLELLEHKERSPGAEEVAELQQTVVQLKLELNDRDQDALLSDLDIGHIPEDNGENVVHTVTVLAAKLGITLESRDVVFAERVGAVDAGGTTAGDGGVGRRARRIVVRLARRHLRDDILRAARVRRNLTSVDCGFSGHPSRIYINERLTRTNRQLFSRVREECRKRQWRYSWTKRGRIYVRQSDGKHVYPIRSDGDFNRVFETGTV